MCIALTSCLHFFNNRSVVKLSTSKGILRTIGNFLVFNPDVASGKTPPMRGDFSFLFYYIICVNIKSRQDNLCLGFLPDNIDISGFYIERLLKNMTFFC